MLGVPIEILTVRGALTIFHPAVLIAAAALALGVLGLLLTDLTPSEASVSETQPEVIVKPNTQRLDGSVLQADAHDVFAAASKDVAAVQPSHTDAPEWAADNIPAEWEQILVAAFTEGDPPLRESNRRLMAIVMQRAVGVPRVQQECLAHLVHGLPDDDLESFRSLALSPTIPVELRRAFVQELLSSRPPELSSALIAALSNNGEVLAPANVAGDLANLWPEGDAPESR